MNMITPPFPFSVSVAAQPAANAHSVAASAVITGSAALPGAVSVEGVVEGDQFVDDHFGGLREAGASMGMVSPRNMRVVRGLPLEVVVPYIREYQQEDISARHLQVHAVVHGAFEPHSVVRSWTQIADAFSSKYDCVELVLDGIQFLTDRRGDRQFSTIRWNELPTEQFHSLLLALCDGRAETFSRNLRIELPDDAAQRLMAWGYNQFNLIMDHPDAGMITSGSEDVHQTDAAIAHMIKEVQRFVRDLQVWEALPSMAIINDLDRSVELQKALEKMSERLSLLRSVRTYASRHQPGEELATDLSLAMHHIVQSDGGVMLDELLRDAVFLVSARANTFGIADGIAAIPAHRRRLLQRLSLSQRGAAQHLQHMLIQLMHAAIDAAHPNMLIKAVNMDVRIPSRGGLAFRISDNGTGHVSESRQRVLQDIRALVAKLGWEFVEESHLDAGSVYEIKIPKKMIAERPGQIRDILEQFQGHAGEMVAAVEPARHISSMEEFTGLSMKSVGLHLRYPRLSALHAELSGIVGDADSSAIVYDRYSAYAAAYLAQTTGIPVNWRSMQVLDRYLQDTLRERSLIWVLENEQPVHYTNMPLLASARFVYWAELDSVPVIPSHQSPLDFLGQRVKPQGSLVLQHRQTAEYRQNDVRKSFADIALSGGWDCLGRLAVEDFVLPTSDGKGAAHVVQIFRRSGS